MVYVINGTVFSSLEQIVNRFHISNFAFDAYATSAGPSAISVLFDTGSVYSTNMPDGALQEINQSVIGYSGLTQITLKIAGWDNGSRPTSGSGAFRLDNLIIEGSVEEIPANDSSSFILSRTSMNSIFISSFFCTYSTI